MILSRFNELLRLGVNPGAAVVDSLPHKGGSKTSTTNSTTTENSTQTTTPYQQQQFDQLLGGAGRWLEGGGLDKNYGGSAGFDPVANMTQEQLNALSGQTNLSSQLNQLLGGQGTSALSSYLQPYDPNATGLNAALDSVNRRLDQNFETQVNPQIRQGAQGAGQYGSSRHGIAEGLARSELSQQKIDAGSQLAFQDQQSYNQNRLNVLGNLGGIASGLNAGNTLGYEAGAIQQGQDQAEIAGQLEKWAYENNVPLNDLLAYQSLISGSMGGTVNSSGVSTTNSKTKESGGGSSPWGALGTLGGAALGGLFGGPAGAQFGAQLGGSAGAALS